MQNGRSKKQSRVSLSEFLVVKCLIAQKAQCLLMQVKIYLPDYPPDRKRDQSCIDESDDQDAQFNPNHKNRYYSFKIGKNFPICQFLYLYIMKTTGLILCMILFLSCTQRDEVRLFEEKVTAALQRQLEYYPESSLRDIYKNFFQDKFGPGHLLSDTASAGRYLRNELGSYDPDTLRYVSSYAEPTGWEHRFVRVDLRVIKEGKVSYRDFFEAFVRSVRDAPEVSVKDWSKEWERIVKVMEKLESPVTHHPSYRADKDSLAAMLQRGEFVVHHSRDYVAAYAPHYRLISVQELQSLGL